VKPQRLAILLMIGEAVLFAAETAVIHQIGTRVPVMTVALLRAAGGLALAAIMARHVGTAVIRTRQRPLQLLRGGVSLLYLWVMVYSFSRLPFADATAISYTQTAYIAAFSVLLLGEAVTPTRWTAAAIGIAGALLIARPAFAGWRPAYLIALGGAALNGFAFVLSRYLQREDSAQTTMFYANLVMVVGNLPTLVMSSLPAPETWPWVPALLVLGPLGMYLGIVAVRHAPASALAPYPLLRLVIGMTGGIAVFGERPDLAALSGATLILGSCALSVIQGRPLTVASSSETRHQ